MASGDLMTRARRWAGSSPEAAAILKFLSSKEGRRELAAAADRGAMPLTAVSAKLVALVGEETLSVPALRRFCGMAARAVLDEEGFEVAGTNVRTRGDAVFGAGAVYKRRLSEPTAADDLLVRLIDSLTPEELRRAAGYIARRRRS